jgi:hypothetical protein
MSAEVAHLLAFTLRILDAEESEITVRHLFYRLVGLKVIEKTERAYKLLCHHLGRWRKGGLVPWNAFADSTRWHIKAQTFNSVEDALQRTRETYRRDLWSTQPHYCELWIEKDAIASIVAGVADEFGVPVFVCRGFASLSSLYSAAQTFNRAINSGKAATIFHLGDYDPSGHAAADAIERTLTENFDCDIEFERLAVLPDQIERLKLPTRPTKRTDSRARKWKGESCVELDAMSPSDMRGIVGDAITSLIEPRAWKQIQKIEAAERESLAKIRVVA